MNNRPQTLFDIQQYDASVSGKDQQIFSDKNSSLFNRPNSYAYVPRSMSVKRSEIKANDNSFSAKSHIDKPKQIQNLDEISIQQAIQVLGYGNPQTTNHIQSQENEHKDGKVVRMGGNLKFRVKNRLKPSQKLNTENDIDSKDIKFNSKTYNKTEEASGKQMSISNYIQKEISNHIAINLNTPQKYVQNLRSKTPNNNNGHHPTLYNQEYETNNNQQTSLVQDNSIKHSLNNSVNEPIVTAENKPLNTSQTTSAFNLPIEKMQDKLRSKSYISPNDYENSSFHRNVTEQNLYAQATSTQLQRNQVSFANMYHTSSPNNNDQINEKNYGFSKHFSSINRKNQNYFNHICGKCRCSRCQCALKHKCVTRQLQYDYLRSTGTQYEKSYPEKEIDIPQPFPLDQSPYRDKLKMIDFLTVTKVDFTEKTKNDDITNVKRESLMVGHVPINQNTVYNGFFQNYVPPKSVPFVHIPHLNVPHQLEWYGDSESRINYQKEEDRMKDIQVINFSKQRNQIKPPIQVDIGFLNQTAYGDFFVQQQSQTPIKNNWGLDDNRKQNTHVFQARPNLAGQFFTTTKMSFKPQNNNNLSFCQAAGEKPDNLDRLNQSYYH